MLFPNCMQPEPYDFEAMDDQEWFINEIIGHQWEEWNLALEVWWSLGDTTWEPLENCKDLTALNRYLELQGIRCPAHLVKQHWKQHFQFKERWLQATKSLFVQIEVDSKMYEQTLSWAQVPNGGILGKQPETLFNYHYQCIYCHHVNYGA